MQDTIYTSRTVGAWSPPRTGSFEDFADGKSGDRALEVRLLATLDEAFKLWQERQRKYGPGNIAAFGAAGCVVRAQDKLARLKRVYFENRNERHTDESIEDSWIDLFNYAIMGLMCVRGQWPGVARAESHTVSVPRGVAHAPAQQEIRFPDPTPLIDRFKELHKDTPFTGVSSTAPCGCNHDAFDSGAEAPTCHH